MRSVRKGHSYPLPKGRSQAPSESPIDPSSREELILRYAPVIRYMASRILNRLPPTVEEEDLVHAGIIGFIDALNRFDPKKNVQFKTYVEYRIRGAMLDQVRALDWLPRSVRSKLRELEETIVSLERQHRRPAEDVEVASALGMDLEDYHDLLTRVRAVPLFHLEELDPELEPKEGPWEEDQEPYRTVWLREITSLLAEEIERLPKKERLVITLYYYEELTMKEIARVLGLTESRVSQLHTKAILGMKKRLSFRRRKKVHGR